MLVNVTLENFEEIKNNSLPLVLDFGASWCGPCKIIAPIMEDLAAEYDGKVVVAKIDVEECEDIAMEYGIRNVPTVLFIKNGEEVDRMVGAASKSKFAEKIDTLL